MSSLRDDLSEIQEPLIALFFLVVKKNFRTWLNLVPAKNDLFKAIIWTDLREVTCKL